MITVSRLNLTLLGAALLSPLLTASAQSPDEAPAAQIVRLSLVQGDVRITRGKAIEKHTGESWEQAVVNLPLEAGYTLATGDGRAEIEFEDASTAYLAPNSVLALNVLTSTAGSPETQMSLLSGTLTLNLHPNTRGDTYLLQTPTDTVSTTFPSRYIARVDSYLDAMAVTEFHPMMSQKDIATLAALTSDTKVFAHGTQIHSTSVPNRTTFAAWDTWVAQRMVERNLHIARVMKAAGLRQPLPGLEELDGKGTFFPCETNARCWEPNTAWNGEARPDRNQPESSPASPATTAAPGLTTASFNPAIRPHSVLAA